MAGSASNEHLGCNVGGGIGKLAQGKESGSEWRRGFNPKTEYRVGALGIRPWWKWPVVDVGMTCGRG